MNRLLLASLLLPLAAAAPAQEQEARVREVLARNATLEQAIADGDADAVAAHFSPEFRLHNAANQILTAEQVVRQFRSGATVFADYKREVEPPYPSGDLVGLRGQGGVGPSGASRDAPPVTRRFTSVWQKTPTGWKQIARQSTNVGAKPPAQ